MGIRERGYWLRQADAVRRQWIAAIAHGIGIGMASKEDGERAIDELELDKIAAVSKEQRSQATWDMLTVFKGGYGV